jgi:hypothetical protein
MSKVLYRNDVHETSRPRCALIATNHRLAIIQDWRKIISRLNFNIVLPNSRRTGYIRDQDMTELEERRKGETGQALSTIKFS